VGHVENQMPFTDFTDFFMFFMPFMVRKKIILCGLKFFSVRSMVKWRALIAPSRQNARGSVGDVAQGAQFPHGFGGDFAGPNGVDFLVLVPVDSPIAHGLGNG
jgi:hypothetical protein